MIDKWACNDSFDELRNETEIQFDIDHKAKSIGIVSI